MEERILESRRIYEGRVVNLRVDTVALPLGRQTTREVVEHSECVAIVALDSDGNVLLVRQFREAVGKALLEIPAGSIEPREKPAQSALRELEEETGYRAGKVERLGGFYSSPGFCTEYLHLFLATDLKQGNPNPAEDEIIDLVRAPLSDVSNLIASGGICDAKSIAGLFALLLLRRDQANSD